MKVGSGIFVCAAAVVAVIGMKEKLRGYTTLRVVV